MSMTVTTGAQSPINNEERAILLALTAQGAKARQADILEADDFLQAAAVSQFDPKVNP
jgi:hypothetical protein